MRRLDRAEFHLILVIESRRHIAISLCGLQGAFVFDRYSVTHISDLEIGYSVIILRKWVVDGVIDESQLHIPSPFAQYSALPNCPANLCQFQIMLRLRVLCQALGSRTLS